MARRVHPPLTGGYLDRDGSTRLDEGALDRAWADPGARLLRVRGRDVAFRERTKDRAALDLVPVAGPRTEAHIYLGRLAGRPVFAVESTAEQPYGAEPLGGWGTPLEFGALLDPAESETMAAALAILAWHESSLFSARDGAATTPVNGGWARRDADGGEHFPRMDPVVIVRIEHEDRLLLGSNVLWETGRFSLLAGFIDAGESAEEAVLREVAEESGLRLRDPRYVASQPWPFPRSFMLGFSARLAEGQDPEALVPDPHELSELRWFSREELLDLPPGIRLPGRMSIAGWLIARWLEEGASAGG
ncbi:MAG: NAD(+) diphosphatase [Leucobacter sp.]|nr:NAD(+) diphosphatase [Leucobacter sp.]